MELTLSCSRGSLKVRPAALEDIPEIMDMGRQFFDQAWSGVFEWDDSSVFETLTGMLRSGVLLVAQKGRELVGMVGGTLAPMYFDKQTLIAQELFWWVRPGNRGPGIALFREFEAVAKLRGAQVVAMNGVESIRGETVGRFYAREGYRCTERVYLKRL